LLPKIPKILNARTPTERFKTEFLNVMKSFVRCVTSVNVNVIATNVVLLGVMNAYLADTALAKI
jgi:hypothetical protein